MASFFLRLWCIVNSHLGASGLSLLVIYMGFYKSYYEESGKQKAMLQSISDRTLKEEEVRAIFDKELEKLKSELQIEVGNTIEPLKADLSILTNRENSLFILEKEAIVEFNQAINSWFWDNLHPQIQNFNSTRVNEIDIDISNRTKAFLTTQLGKSKLQLTVSSDSLILLADRIVNDCLGFQLYTNECLGKIGNSLRIINHLDEKYYQEPNESAELDEDHFIEIGRTRWQEHNKVETIKAKYISEFQSKSGPIIEGLKEFIFSAKLYLKKST